MYCNRYVDSRVYIKLPCLVYAQENLVHKHQRYLSMCISPFYPVHFTFLLSSFYFYTFPFFSLKNTQC